MLIGSPAFIYKILIFLLDFVNKASVTVKKVMLTFHCQTKASDMSTLTNRKNFFFIKLDNKVTNFINVSKHR